MECPKCGVVQPESLEECSSCGIVFERWHDAQTRAKLISSKPVEFTPAEKGIPRWAFLLGLVLFIALGVGWTIKRRAFRASNGPQAEFNAKMDRINKSGNAIRERMRATEQADQESRDRVKQEAAKARKAPRRLRWPEGLSEATAKGLIESCSGFTERRTDRLPKTFREDSYVAILKQFPLLTNAIDAGLFELDPPLNPDASPERNIASSRLIWVKPTPAGTSSLGIVFGIEEYSIDSGRKRVAKFTNIDGKTAQIATFSWTFENPGGVALTSELSRTGWATFRQDSSGWRVVDVTLTNRYKVVCKSGVV